MTNPQEAWAEATDRLSALALKLKLHTEEELAEAGVSADELVDKLGTAIKSAAEALSDAGHDDAIRQDLREVGSAIADALRVTVQQAKERIER
jgi:predicted ArsR family transcriptional regulator